MGRGIQKETPHGPWVLTQDLEVLADDGAHAIVRRPVDDSNPSCLLGGGELNLLAGLELYKLRRPRTVVCAYGHRAGYLKEADAPTESEVMSAAFLQRCMEKKLPEPEVIVWPKDRDVAGPSNTDSELRNILELAAERRCPRILIVSLAVHMPRAVLFTAQHLASPRFAGHEFHIKSFQSEAVLIGTDPRTYAERVLKLQSSEAFRRNAARELWGVEAFLKGGYYQLEAWRPYRA